MACILGYFLLGVPLNLLYSNSVFSELRGFPHSHVSVGDLRDIMMQKMGVDPVSNLSDYLQVQFSNLPEGEQREMIKDFRGSAS